jgi:subtilisin-like proprotein convertase family protein
MFKKGQVRIAVLACAGVAALGLVVASPAAAKAKKKAVTKTATVSQCVSTNSAILDPGEGVAPATAAIPVSVPNFKGAPQDGAIASFVSAGVGITHTSDGDLQILLVSPGGKVVGLSLGRGQTANGFGTGTGCGSVALFGDSFANPIAGANPSDSDDPLVGPFSPEQPLNALLGGPARGIWNLIVIDKEDVDEGALNAFSLNFTYSYRALVKAKKHKK